MRKRWIFLMVAAVALVALTAGIAFAAGRGATTPTSTGQGMVQACDAMHDSPAMERMHEQMPAALQAQCDAMHEQMNQMMGGFGMMGGSGMMGGLGMMEDQSMAGHHASTPGER